MAEMEKKEPGRHRKLEGWWGIFTVLVTLSILVGTLVELVPILLIYDKTPTIETVKPFTPLEVVGRDIYISEGCNNCHSQMVRPFRQEMERYGPYSRAGETIYEHPFLWGSKRTGPDLARVGGKYPNLWHVLHMRDPRSTSPQSIMPPYPWLLEKSLNFDAIPGKLGALQTVGVPYTDAEIEGGIAHAKAQAQSIADDVVANGGPSDLADKQIIAMVAYLQRLGQDIKAANLTNTTE